jgi:hypothetical protein
MGKRPQFPLLNDVYVWEGADADKSHLLGLIDDVLCPREGNLNREPFRSRFFFVFFDLQVEMMQDPVENRCSHYAHGHEEDYARE